MYCVFVYCSQCLNAVDDESEIVIDWFYFFRVVAEITLPTSIIDHLCYWPLLGSLLLS